MRYAEAQFGEDPIAIGIFSPGDAVSIKLVELSTDTELLLSTSGCTELSVVSGFFVWSTSGIVTPLSDFHQLLYIMENAEGRQHVGKLVVGGYPSDSALRRFGGFVHIDVENGVSGTAFPIGARENPCNNVDDARTIANSHNIPAFLVRGDIVVSGDYSNWTFEGVEPTDDTVTFAAGAVTSGSQFAQMGVRGILDGAITCQECLVGAGGVTSGLEGILNTCGAQGTLKVTGPLQCLDLASQSLVPGTTFDLADPNASMVLMGHATGIFLIDDLGPAQLLGVSLAGGSIYLKNTCSGGFAFLYGYGEVVDNSTGTSVTDNVLKGSELQAVAPDIAAVAGDVVVMAAELGVVSGDVAGVQSTLDVVSGDVLALAIDVERLYGRNTRTRLWYADAEVVSGQGGALRNVPNGVASHMETQVKTDAQADWSGPTTFYVVFNYAAAATATTPPASAEPSATAPADGTFSAEPYPA